MLDTLSILAVFFLVLSPGLAVITWLDRGGSWWKNVGPGLALGAALAVARAVVLHRVGLLHDRALLWSLEGALFGVSGLALALAFLRNRKQNERTRGKLRVREGLALLAILVGSSVLRMIPHRMRPEALQVPDAPQHCTLTTALLLTPGRGTWEPFMDAPLRYPWGSHALVAELHTLTGVPVWGVFSVLLTAGFGLLSTLALVAFAAEIWDEPRHAIGSGYAYAFLSVADGAVFSRWGGLPTEVCFCFALAMGAVLLRGGRLLVLLPVFVTAIFLCNTLLPLIIGWAFAWGLAATAWAFPERRRGCLMAAMAAALGVLPALPMWLQVIDFDAMGKTIAFQLHRHMDLFDMGHTHVGAYLVLLAALALFARRSPTAIGRLVVLASIAALLVAFTGIFTLYKLATGLADAPRTMLVPSRWATALTYPLAAFAGGGVVALWERLGKLRFVVAASLAMSPIYPLWRLSFQRVDAAAFAAFEYVRGQADPRDMVISMVPHNDAWANAVTRMEANDVATPPGSDPLTRRALANKRLRRIAKLDGNLPGELADDPPRRYFLVVNENRHRLVPSTRRVRLTRVGHVSVHEWFPRRAR
ncbi:MAG: hypothetical protein MJD61_17115 [Proteobacteria bacterium]|nr:hypothetical protein [Pseudomonadota bacterium]